MSTLRVSLTGKILALLILPTILCLSGFGVTSALHRRHEIEVEADRDLEDYVTVLEGALPPLARQLDDRALIELLERMARRQRVHGISTYDHACHLIARSENYAPARATHMDAIACAALARGGVQRDLRRDGDVDVLVHADVVEGVSEIGVIAVGYELNEVRDAIRDTTLRLAMAGAVLVAVMAAIAFLVARRLGGSLTDLLTGAQQVAAGNLQVRLAERGMLGTADVARGFNHMAIALASAQEQLEAAAHQRHDLERRVSHAQTLSVVGQVAASFAHDIGTPLSTILMASRMSAEDESLPERARQQFELVATQCDRITRIVKQLLSVARPGHAEREPVDLGSVVDEVVAFVRPEGSRRRVRIRAEKARESIVVTAERDALLQMLVNLAMNGLQAQPGGGTLVIALRRDGDRVVLEVRDAGPGITPDERTRVFEPFFSTKAPGEGTGLGLSIAAGVVKELDGSIEIDEAPEGGACVRVKLPASPEQGHL